MPLQLKCSQVKLVPQRESSKSFFYSWMEAELHRIFKKSSSTFLISIVLSQTLGLRKSVQCNSTSLCDRDLKNAALWLESNF